ncbi:MAG: cytochrome c3 family protein [Rhodocyclaceae bacterium]
MMNEWLRGTTAPRLALALALLTASLPAAARTSIANTVHNLTPTGPGSFRAPEPVGLCAYCHTPHNASPQRGLWNRALSGATYQLYESSTLKAQVKQPTGASRLCLSCHDGTLAMGTLRVAPVQPTLGVLTGTAVVGTDLSDDHPVSFVYDSVLAANRGELTDPLALPKAVRPDHQGELQCTSCHDAHEDRNAHFLRMDNRYAALCTTCHTPSGWGGSSHSSSMATWNGSGTRPWPAAGYATVAENGCLSCHRPHGAGHGRGLLAQPGESANCNVCHAGAVAAKNIQSEFLKSFRHPVEIGEWTHAPREDAALMSRHVACADCHNAHAANATATALPAVPGRMQGVRGIDQGGGLVAPANFEYEVCYKCHGLASATTSGILRQDNVRNARLQFDPANPSYHPVAAVGRNPAITGLAPGYSASSRIGCTSCHDNDAAGSGGPAGPHGSIYPFILGRQYQTDETVAESPQAYALCYACHTRSSLTIDLPGRFPHARHLINGQNSCAACHDAHGSRTSPRLINFMLRDRNGIAVVTPSAVQKRMEYIPGAGGGQCYLMCHGVNHEPKVYP